MNLGVVIKAMAVGAKGRAAEPSTMGGAAVLVAGVATVFSATPWGAVLQAVAGVLASLAIALPESGAGNADVQSNGGENGR